MLMFDILTFLGYTFGVFMAGMVIAQMNRGK